MSGRSQRPSTANPINMGRSSSTINATITSTRRSSRRSNNEGPDAGPATNSPKNIRPSTSIPSSSRRLNSTRSQLNHSPPRFLMDGAQLPFGKSAGLSVQQGPILSLSGKVFVPKSWTGVPKHKSKKDLYVRRKLKDKIQQNELQRTLDKRLNIVKRPTLRETYGRVLAGCVPIPCTTDTQTDLFRTRSEQYLTSIQNKSKRREEMMLNHPSKERNEMAIKDQVRSWEKNQPVKSRYEQLIAPIGRDSELARKTIWTKDYHPYIGPGYRQKPPFPTKKKLLKSRSKEINELVTTKINESWNRNMEIAERNEKLARSATFNTHVPLHKTQSELFAKRLEVKTSEAAVLKKKAIEEHKVVQQNVLNAPEVARGWWQKGDREINPSDVLTKGSAVRLKMIAQRKVLPQKDPFKTYETSIHTLNRTKTEKQRQSVEIAVVDRSGPEWTQGASHLPKQPSIPVKRWSDVVIEFQQADAKLDAERMNIAGGGEGGGEGGGATQESLDDTRPLFSSFTPDQIFREPQYPMRKAKLDEQASYVLQPLGGYDLGGIAGKRALTLMQRSRRASRFRESYAHRLRDRQNGGTMNMGSIHAASSFGAEPPGTPGQNDRERFRDRGSSRGNPSRQSGGLAGLGDVSRSNTPGGGDLGPSASMSSMSGLMGANGQPGSRKESSRDIGGNIDGNRSAQKQAQSVPDLTIHQKNRAKTAPSDGSRSVSGLDDVGSNMRMRAGTPLGMSRGSSRQSRNISARPGTAPLRMTKRPGTAVRTRGFWDN